MAQHPRPLCRMTKEDNDEIEFATLNMLLNGHERMNMSKLLLALSLPRLDTGKDKHYPIFKAYE